MSCVSNGPLVSKKGKNKKKGNLFSKHRASEATSGKIVFAIQDELQHHQTYEVMIEGETYPFELQTIRKQETDDRAFFVAKGRLLY